MYRILIVDDEKKEREGIALLIRKFKLPLDVTLACNGEEALEIISRSRYDILLTDIKMPYMDGIQLITEVQKKGLSPICIIYSAYGEFEYARNAISLGVLEYLLKPIQFEAFLDLFNKVIGLCRQKEENEQKKIEIQQIKEEVAAHKIGWDFLNFLEGEENELSFQNVKEKLKKELPDFMDMQKDVFIPILISSYSNLFALEWEKYRKAIEEQFGENTIIINTADNQIVVLVIEDMGAYRQAVGKTKCMSFIELSQTNYQADIFVVLGKVCTGIEELKKEYTELKDQLDYQFFVSKSQLLVHDESYFFKKENDML